MEVISEVANCDFMGNKYMTNDKAFALLADDIKNINIQAGNAAKGAVNQLMTLRNWVIGYYIVEYEQDGKDRAEYGSNLMENLEKSIDEKGLNVTLFKSCRQFYKTDPQIRSTVSNEFIIKPELLVKRLSFSHIREEGKTSAYKWVTPEALRSMSRNELATQRMLNFIKDLK